MFLQRLRAPRPAVQAGRALFAGAAVQARTPDFYEAGVPDTPEGRFELYSLHVALLLRRLKGEAPQVVETRQVLFDAYVRNLDDGLREMGVGDLSVGKKMRKLGAAVYGRLRSLNDALAASDAPAAAALFLDRTVMRGQAPPSLLDSLARYVLEADRALAAQPLSALLQGEISWPPFRA